jgi:DNA-binding XRE family transcriptional regulator
MADKKRNHKQTAHAAEDKARHKAIRKKLKGRPTPEELIQSGAYEQPVPHGLVLDAMRLLGQLRAVREAAKLTLAELSDASGIAKPALSRLETGRQDNPTLMTVLRYAHALGKRLVWTLQDDEAPAGNKRKMTTRKRTAS